MSVIFAPFSENLVLRVPILYGDVEFLGESAITVLFEKLKQLQKNPDLKAQMSDLEIRRPSHVNDVAQICHDLLMLKAKVITLKGLQLRYLRCTCFVYTNSNYRYRRFILRQI